MPSTSVSGGTRGLARCTPRGSVLKGTFTATPDAAALTRAASHAGRAGARDRARVQRRRRPSEPDYAPDVRGLASSSICPTVRGPTSARRPRRASRPARSTLHRPGSGQRGRLLALWKLPLFLARHPKIALGLPAGAAALKPPASYATLRYYALHAFKWIDADGGERYVRYTWEPEAGVQTIPGKEAKAKGRDYLREEILARVAGGPVRFSCRCRSRARATIPTIRGAVARLARDRRGRDARDHRARPRARAG